jgi:hypothetical protein
LLEQHDIEIDQESHAMAGQLQVGQRLRLVEARQCFNRFYLDDDCILDDQIEAIPNIEPRFPIENR